jgi:hypothetical protein
MSQSRIIRFLDTLWEGVVHWFVHETLNTLLGTAIAAVFLGWIAHEKEWLGHKWTLEWDCIRRSSCTVEGWTLGALIVVTAAAIIGACVFAFLWRRSRKRTSTPTLALREPVPGPPKFQDIEVLDHRLNLRWWIRRPPNEWLNWRNVVQTQSDVVTRQVLDGPFHAVDGCNAALGEIQTPASISGGLSPQFDEKCRNCGRHVFEGARRHQDLGVTVWPVRAAAIEELQRMQRNGTKVPTNQWRDPIVLENPGYWKEMLPAGDTDLLRLRDVYLEVSNDSKIEFKRKLRIVLQNDSSREIILRRATWQQGLGDIPIRPHNLEWDRESGQGWASKTWVHQQGGELTAKPSQVFCTWIGLTPEATEDDVRIPGQVDR